MEPAINDLAAKAHVRISALLRARQYFSRSALVRMYKAQVLSFIEYATPAIHHAPRFFLAQVDRVQDTFLDEIGLSAQAALLQYGLAPLSCRRDIAMLGLIHRTTTGKAPEHFTPIFCRQVAPSFPRCLRDPALRHDHQLLDRIDGTHSRMMERSVLGLIYAYNVLPQRVINAKSVKLFQRKLQNAVKQAAKQNSESFTDLFRSGIKSMRVSSFQSLFD